MSVISPKVSDARNNEEIKRMINSAKTLTSIELTIEKLLPENKAFFAYFGSLTTPGCNSVVLWHVFKDIQNVSKQSVRWFEQTWTKLSVFESL